MVVQGNTVGSAEISKFERSKKSRYKKAVIKTRYKNPLRNHINLDCLM